MSQFRDRKIQMKQLMNEICKEIKGLTQEVFLTIWEAFRKFTFQQLQLDRTIVVLDSFYLQMIKDNQSKLIRMMPTSTLLAEYSLKYRSDDNDLANIGSLVSVTQSNLFKYIQSKDKECLEITKQDAYFIYTFCFKYIKNILKKYKNVSLQLDFLGMVLFQITLGSILIYQRTFIHEPELKNANAEKIKVKQLIEKEAIQNLSDLKRKSILSRSKINLLEKPKNRVNFSSFSSLKINDQSGLETFEQFKRKLSPQLTNQIIQKRPFFHEMLDSNKSENVRITNDLLGAGIDPLTYDYNHSKLVQNTLGLFYYKFQKPERAKSRLPGLIDKFSRTIGAQLTGAKVSTSSSIRIGSNYNPSAKNYYIDLSMKQIMRVPQQITIKLQEKTKEFPATESQQYEFVIHQEQIQNEELHTKVNLRKKTFERYLQYCIKQIPNDCIAPLSRETLKNIADKIKEIVKSLGKILGKEIFDKLLNQVNRFYYISGKKAIVDYILKDESQKHRTGIALVFKPAHDWGIVKPSQQFPQIRKQNTCRKKIMIENQFLTYPELILEIVKHNQILDGLSPYNLEVQKIIRPMNILYHLKKHSNNFTQTMNFLNEKWVKGAVEIIMKNKNWKKQNTKNFKTFMNNVHTLMSNKLKDLVYRTLKVLTSVNNMFDYQNPPAHPKPYLYLHLGEQNRKIIFMDDLNNIYRKQAKDIHRTMLRSLSQILSPQCYIREGQERYLWSIDPNDQFLIDFNESTEEIVERNYQQIQKIKNGMKRFQKIYRYKDELLLWAKTSFQSKELDFKLRQLKTLQTQIDTIPFYEKTLIAVIDLHDLKKKLYYQIKIMRYYLFECIQNLVKKIDESITERIKNLQEQTSKDIKTTTDYVELSKLINFIKEKELVDIEQLIKENQKLLMKLFTIQTCFVSQDLLKEIYSMQKSLSKLQQRVTWNEERIAKERSQLQKTLKQRISNFQALTVSQFREINYRIDSFDIRKLYTQYLVYLTDFKQKSEKNMKQMMIINHQQDDLKWACTPFTSAIELENLIAPNFELWRLIEFYDQNIREWKHLELSNFDIQETESRMIEIDTGISKIINKLKNFSSLKIAHELQNDIKQVINKQLPIIKIFSHPGLKQRHWHLFSKKLSIPGYDLKEITYGRIKILYDYDKNLKVLASISNQAAKQFQIQNEKMQMSTYWLSLNTEVRTDSVDEQLVFLQDDFLNLQFSTVEDHLMRTLLLKNSPFSKALSQMLTDWENYLLTAKSILVGFKYAQEGFLAIKDIFKIDDINKYLPIQTTEFQSIENIWRTVIKKVLEQPKISELFKSQKIIEVLEEITKKSIHIKSSLPVYLHSKRVEFPRFFFTLDSDLIEIFSFLNKGNQKQALIRIAKHCYNGLQSIQKFDKGYRLRSSIDYMDIVVQKQATSKKQKIRIIEDASQVLAQSKQKIKTEIQILLRRQNFNQSQAEMSKYTVTSLLAVQHIFFSQKLNQIKKQMVNSSDKVWKQLQKLSKQIIEFIGSKQREVNMNQIRKTDFIVFRKLCYREILQYLQRKNNGFPDSSQLQAVPKLCFKENDSDGNQLVLQFSSHSIDYDYEYIGSDVLSFQPLGPLSFDFMSQMLRNVRSGDITILNSIDAKIATRLLSQLSGKFYKEIDFVGYLSYNINGIYEILAGLVSSDVWINLNMDHNALLSLAANNLSLTSEIMEQKKTKIIQHSDYLLVKQNEIPIYKCNAVFFYISTDISNQLPDRLFSSCRNLSIPSYENFQYPLMQFLLQNQIFFDWETMSMIKIVIQILKNLHPEVNLSMMQIMKEFNSILIGIQQGENSKNKKIVICKMLQKVFKDDLEQKNIRNFLKLPTKELQGNLQLKKQPISITPSQVLIGFPLYLKQKSQKLEIESKFNDIIIVYGSYGYKTTIIHNYLQKYNFSKEECQEITLNTCFLSYKGTQNIPSVSVLIDKAMKSYIKITKANNLQNINPVIFDGLINDERLSVILKSIRSYKKKKPSCPLISLIECPTLDSLSPKSITSIGKVFINNYQQSDKTIFEEWADKFPLKSQQIDYLKNLGMYLQGILDFTIKNKHILANMNRDYPVRYIMIRCFLKFLEIYLVNLNSKEVESMPEFDTEEYIVNSFVFAAYWALGVGFAIDDSKRGLEIYLKEVFGSKYDIPHSIEENFLNQENEWVNWQNLKEQFAPQKQSDAPLCSLWVPTIENTKFYTIIIKLLEKDLPLLVLGSQSGKSTLIREISNFQISYATFIIDCNKRTDVFRVGKLIRDRIVYGDEKKHLILVDDLHLPVKIKQTRINELILQIVKTNSIPTFSQFGTINQKLKKSNVLMSANLNQESCLSGDLSTSTLITRFQPLNLRKIDQKQMQYIFKSYLSYFFNHNEFQNHQILRLEGLIILILGRIFDSQKFLKLSGRQFAIDVNDMKKIVDSICRINTENFKDKFQVLNYLIYQSNTLLSAKIELSALDFDKKHSSSEVQSYSNFKKTLEGQHMKFCNPEKNPKQFENLLSTYIYRDVSFYDATVQADRNQMKNKMKNHLKVKNIDLSFVLSSSIVNEIQKILHFLQAPSSHIIFVSPKRTGARSLIKVVSQLRNVNYIELGTTYQVDQFLQEVIKILKTGGKVDECICCLPNDKQKQESFLGVVNSLVSSSQFYESLNQMQLQQIIKSYNNEKKVLKKNIKKSEIIKKIKEKLNSLFHFVVCIEKQQLNDIADLYPNMLKQSFIYMHDPWNEQAMMEIFTGVCETDKDQIKKISKAFQSVYSALNQVKVEQKSREPLKKSYDLIIISLMEIYSVFSLYFGKLEQVNNQSINLWARKIALNEVKLNQLMSEKAQFQQLNKNRFHEIEELKKMVEEKSYQLAAKKAEFKQIDSSHNLLKDKQLEEKTKFYMESDEFFGKMNLEWERQFDIVKDQKLSLKDCSEKSLIRLGVPRYETLSGKEEFEVTELRQFLEHMKNEGFQFLIETYPNMQILQQQMKKSTQPLQTALLTVITTLWSLIIQNNKHHLELKALSQQYIQEEQLYFKFQSQIRLIEDQIDELKEEIDQMSQKHLKLLDSHEEITGKITHLESLLEILRKVKSTVQKKVGGDLSGKSQEVGVQKQEYFGWKILLTVCIKQGISNTESNVFKAIKQGLSAVGYEISQKNIAHVLPSQQQISIDYCLNDNSFQSILNFLVVELSPIYCSVIDPENQIETYLREWSQRPISFFESENIEQLKSLIMNPGFVLIPNPKGEFIHQLKPLLTYTRDKSINSQFVGQQIGSFSFHKDSKIIFLYSSRDQIDQRIIKSSTWICEINHSPYASKILQNFICRLTSNRDTYNLASLFIQKQKQLQSLGQKMHSLVLRMKKENLNIEQIQQRIGEANSIKIGIEKDLRNLKSELKQIFNPKPQLYKHVQLIISFYNAYQIRLSDLLLLIKDIYQLRQNHIHRSIEQLSNIFQCLIKKKQKRIYPKVEIKQVHERKKTMRGEKKRTYIQIVQIEKKYNLEQLKGIYLTQMSKINQSLLTEFIKLLSKENCLLKTQEPKILRKTLLTYAMKDDLPLIQRKITEINSITFMPNLWILTQIKTVNDWEILIPLIKNIIEKKLSIRLLIFTSQDIRIPNTVRNMKQFVIASVLPFLIKIICQSQYPQSLQRAIQLYHQLFIQKNQFNRYQKLSILEHELQSLEKKQEFKLK